MRTECSHVLAACTLAASLLIAPSTRANPISGFESGLTGWEYLGDVSIQTAAIGLAPTQGSRMAFISTMCDRDRPPAEGGGCNTTTNEHPYSGVSSPETSFARDLLGLPSSGLQSEFLAVMPPIVGYSNIIAGESGAMRLRFFAPQPGLLTFDWNRIGMDGDVAYFSIWADDPTAGFRVNDWLYVHDPVNPGVGFQASGVDLCSRYYDVAPSAQCGIAGSFPNSLYNVETGWANESVHLSAPGWYWIGFGLGETAEGTAPTVLALDNLRFTVPSPGTAALVLLALPLLGAARARRRAL